MAELPYFKFNVAEWLTGDIVYESFSIQGLFINICAIYWQRKGCLSLSDINKRFKNPAELSELTDRFFSVSDGFVSIAFLDEQFTERKTLSKNNSKNGSKGGRPKSPENKDKKTDRLFSESEHKAKQSNIEKKREEKNNTVVELNFEFVESAWKVPFSVWVKYMSEKKKPFTIQMSLEAAYSELKQMSGGNALEAMKIIQYTVSGGWVTFCKPNKQFNQPIQTTGLQGTI